MPGSRVGTLIAVGGGEDKQDAMAILRRALEHAPAARRVAIIPTASGDPLWAAQLHAHAFHKLSAAEVDVLNIRTRHHASQEAYVERVRKADLVYMTGGDQSRLSMALAETPVLAAMREKLAEGGVIAGTSAGAAAMSAIMIAEGDSTLRKGGVRLATGLGIFPDALLDTHFTERGRFARLMEAVATHPHLLGIGLGEDAAIAVRGRDVEVLGSGSVVVIDGRELTYTNIQALDPDQPVHVERLIVHAFSEGRCFRLPTAAPLRAPEAEEVRV